MGPQDFQPEGNRQFSSGAGQGPLPGVGGELPTRAIWDPWEGDGVAGRSTERLAPWHLLMLTQVAGAQGAFPFPFPLKTFPERGKKREGERTRGSAVRHCYSVRGSYHRDKGTPGSTLCPPAPQDLPTSACEEHWSGLLRAPDCCLTLLACSQPMGKGAPGVWCGWQVSNWAQQDWLRPRVTDRGSPGPPQPHSLVPSPSLASSSQRHHRGP